MQLRFSVHKYLVSTPEGDSTFFTDVRGTVIYAGRGLAWVLNKKLADVEHKLREFFGTRVVIMRMG